MASTGLRLSASASKRAQSSIFAVLRAFVDEQEFIHLSTAPHSRTPLGTLLLEHDNKHAVRFKLRWKESTHYLGYLVNFDGTESQAVVALYNAWDRANLLWRTRF